MPCARGFTLSAVLSATLVIPHPLVAATLPTGFTESVVANGLQNPTAMAFAPDGRLFVCGGWITFTGVVRMVRTIGAPSLQVRGKFAYSFRSWSDGGAQTHDITTPAANTTYSASFSKSKQ